MRAEGSHDRWSCVVYRGRTPAGAIGYRADVARSPAGSETGDTTARVSKEHILAEISRTAEANGGLALGQKRFAEQTGIRPNDWWGIHWARWSDAVTEAGFALSNLNAAFEEEHILAEYAHFVREIGRLPVEAEIRLRRKSDPTFPSHNTFRRLGPRRELMAKVAEYCRGRADLDDVASLCLAEVAALNEKQETPASRDGDAVEFGFVYLVRSGGHYKIGKTNAVGRRERELAIQLPEKSTTVHTIRTDDPVGIEAYWHRRFADRRRNGEWFELTVADAAAFRRRKFM